MLSAPMLCFPAWSRGVCCVVLCWALTACALHHVTPYVPDASVAPQSADAALASGSCAEAGTAVELAICAQPALIEADRAMLQVLHAQIRTASIFGRDALLANQRAWLLSLPVECRLGEANSAPGPETVACLARSLAAHRARLQDWPADMPAGRGAVAQYVDFRPASGGSRADAAFCGAFADRARHGLRITGTLDPVAMGYAEVAGSYGPASAPPVSVDLYDANVFALFQRRARGVAISGVPVIGPASLTQAIEAGSAANQGGRFSAFASQTGDYGSIDVFRADGRLLAMAVDAWGSTTPASPGEAAHAGIWSLSGTTALPVCLYDIYVRPAEPGPFDSLEHFAAWRAALSQIRESVSLPLGTAVLRDQGQLGADSDFVILHMPLLGIEQGSAPGRTLWLRHRHDQVLDALFAWSTRSAANKALFDAAFAQLRPAATELVRAYQTTQGLTAAEATQAGGIAIMELLYQASLTIAPSLGSTYGVGDAGKPLYPILASPR